jgi:hypothetical protein
MNLRTKLTLAVAILFAAAFFGIPQAQADTWDKMTTVTVSEPLRLPTVVLQPGTYELRLVEDNSYRHVIQVSDKSGRVLTTFLAVPNYRLRATGKTEFQYWEVPAGQTKALRAWFYPGDNFGHEFVYPKGETAQLSADANAKIPTTTAQSNEELSTAPLENVDESAKPEEPATNSVETAAQTAAAEPTPAPSPQETVQAQPQPAAPALAGLGGVTGQPAPVRNEPDQLPQTGSNIPVIGAVGVASWLLAFLAGRIRAGN